MMKIATEPGKGQVVKISHDGVTVELNELAALAVVRQGRKAAMQAIADTCVEHIDVKKVSKQIKISYTEVRALVLIALVDKIIENWRKGEE